MSATRRQMLLQAQRNLDMADQLAEQGDFSGAARNAAAAKALIFPAQSTTQPPSRSVAVHQSNTGCCRARSRASLA
jgi:hypothetical protein